MNIAFEVERLESIEVPGKVAYYVGYVVGSVVRAIYELFN